MKKETRSKGIILFADNDPVFLNAGIEILTQEGFTVLPVTCPIEARKLLKEGQIDLAILCARLKDDTNEKDLSGIELAWETSPFIPRIILTRAPNLRTVWLALESYPEKTEFVAKDDGPEELLSVVKALLFFSPSPESFVSKG